MSEKRDENISVDLNQLAIQGMLEKKATDIVLIDLRNIKKSVADYFIICSGGSDTQLDAIADSVEHEVKKSSDQLPWKKEGQTNKEWMLLDYVTVVVHIFKKEARAHYGLEELWGDGKVTYVTEPTNSDIFF